MNLLVVIIERNEFNSWGIGCNMFPIGLFFGGAFLLSYFVYFIFRGNIGSIGGL